MCETSLYAVNLQFQSIWRVKCLKCGTQISLFLLVFVAGKDEAETALQMGDQSAECHQWYVITSFVKKRQKEENCFIYWPSICCHFRHKLFRSIVHIQSCCPFKCTDLIYPSSTNTYSFGRRARVYGQSCLQLIKICFPHLLLSANDKLAQNNSPRGF